ncbi:DNA-binding transcriptional regulator [Iodobacter sp.]|uniref:helix-turn-helix domain-containing protein n=1 Tax=Iodobacter sp. TaxID=1915058 RepID=UPI0025E187F8|nr:helix-turn-helix domain-containing protein [Iodobacter sp.]
MLSKPLSDEELTAFEANRDIAAELEESVRQMLAGDTHPVPLPAVIAARAKTGLSQAAFSALLGVSAKTLQAWEQGRRKPSKAAQTLLKIANDTPEILRKYAV